MSKGLFTQGFVVLLSNPTTLDEIEGLIAALGTPHRKPASESWEISGPALVIPYRPEVNGYVSVDLVSQAWPDAMGSPKEEPILFGSWSMGHFGPFTYPQNLSRALQQSWNWRDATQIVPSHKAFIRIRSSYIFGAGPEVKCIPQDYAPYPELQFLNRIIYALMDHPKAVAYFNPAGEVLMGRQELESALEYSKAHSLPPLNVWTNVRMFSLNGDWMMMDTVGLGQLDLRDQEALFQKTAFAPNQIANFLRNVSLYLLNNGEIIKDGNTMDGPSNCRWQAKSFDKSGCAPPRQILRWRPCNGSQPPEQLLET